ncbi:hypothetical protein [Kitasatospora sp. MAP5-34]|nr:hypothetical protein [Kitasatospora sp. MAP5-34]MDH6579920.1 hypothetical protein [Kitasatospora sp. MAP5-34]
MRTSHVSTDQPGAGPAQDELGADAPEVVAHGAEGEVLPGCPLSCEQV